jgi:hypothetical protein
MCAGHGGSEQCRITGRRLAPLSSENVKRLPRDILNAILGNAAMHMVARNPGNSSIERLALETKVALFQSMSRLFQHPLDQRPDVLFCCITLLFAMDVGSPPRLNPLTTIIVSCSITLTLMLHLVALYFALAEGNSPTDPKLS